MMQRLRAWFGQLLTVDDAKASHENGSPGAASCGLGGSSRAALHGQRGGHAQRQRRRRPAAPPAWKVELYSRSHCLLCDDALELLQEYGFQPTVIDIDADPDLQTKYTTCVPVVAIDGKVRFRGYINEVLLRRLIRKAWKKEAN